MNLMNKIFLSFCGIFFCAVGFSQGLLNNGAKINTSAGTFIYINGGAAVGNFLNQDAGAFVGSLDNGGTIDLTGNWTNNSTANAFTTNSGTVRLIGVNQNISGATPTWFNNLTLGGTGTKTLNVNTLVGGGFAAPAGKLTPPSPAMIRGGDRFSLR